MPLIKEPEIQLKAFYDTEIESDFHLRKELFLDSLRSTSNKQKYKRYIGTPLRYAGGKTLAVGLIVELLPNNLSRIISPFFGGGSFEIACAKELSVEVIGFDIFDLLVNYWQHQFSQPEEMYKYLKKYNPTKEGFVEVKEILKEHWKKTKLIKNKLELAALYYFNHNTSYGPGFLSWPSSVYMDKKKYFSMIEKSRKLKLKNISVHCDTFENTFEKYPNDFFYCDPPYFLNGNSKMFRGIYPQRNFPIHHNNFAHEKLKDLLLSHKGNFILSYNDCSQIREWYNCFEIINVSWQYTMGQGETRIGFNRINGNRNHIKQSHEILIVKR
ncbi:MAG: DNA adenine methylase [Bacteroidota bacterium]